MGKMVKINNKHYNSDYIVEISEIHNFGSEYCFVVLLSNTAPHTTKNIEVKTEKNKNYTQYIGAYTYDGLGEIQRLHTNLINEINNKL